MTNYLASVLFVRYDEREMYESENTNEYFAIIDKFCVLSLEPWSVMLGQITLLDVRT